MLMQKRKALAGLAEVLSNLCDIILIYFQNFKATVVLLVFEIKDIWLYGSNTTSFSCDFKVQIQF